MNISQRADYTFQYNQKLGRHGWLRLTPAYSVKLVTEIIKQIPKGSYILDPFSGTATTGLVAAEHGLYADCFDINPFLIWLGNVKCRQYAKKDIEFLEKGISQALTNCKYLVDQECWTPNIHNITRWWSNESLKVISALRQALVDNFGEPNKHNEYAVAWIAFCRLVIETSSASFNHVSMSFHDDTRVFSFQQITKLYKSIFYTILNDVDKSLNSNVTVAFADARKIHLYSNVQYSHVITSPPYPNRISYIRELRPYMYWMKYLETPREAGELDWQAIGGTWGIATSRLKNWQPIPQIDFPLLLDTVGKIMSTAEKNSYLMATYVYKYFQDIYVHLANLRNILLPEAKVMYIVGNSSFYSIQVQTHTILEEIFYYLGYKNVESTIIRKRNSKKELFEYCVSATWNTSIDNMSIKLPSATEKSAQLSFFTSSQ